MRGAYDKDPGTYLAAFVSLAGVLILGVVAAIIEAVG